MLAAKTHSITPDDITVVVTEFYRRARGHPVLGSVFQKHVSDWVSHEDKIGHFWRGALLRDRGYSGNPMQKHIAAGNVQPEHFPIWLEVFDAVLRDVLPKDKANHWSTLAHRIGQSLSYGLVYASSKAADLPPKF
jgi:hemoglobin